MDDAGRRMSNNKQASKHPEEQSKSALSVKKGDLQNRGLLGREASRDAPTPQTARRQPVDGLVLPGAPLKSCFPVGRPSRCLFLATYLPS
jgi:hypothetical protein